MFSSNILKFFIAAAALFAVTAAVPIDAATAEVANKIPTLASLDVNADINVNADIDRRCLLGLSGCTVSASATATATPTSPSTIPAILLNLETGTLPILGNIKAILKANQGVGVSLDIDALNGLLGQLNELLEGGLGGLNGSLPLGGALAADIARLLAGLISPILSVILSILSLGGSDVHALDTSLSALIKTLSAIVTAVVASIPVVGPILGGLLGGTILGLLSGLGLDILPLRSALSN
ncbi:hypothetical protein D9611_007813 [Ephemerocybe angulata]|uniref:Uncharacterized protein n=1 Tax=Ephemerocybe angulata TaxID=980116 RepID=A0A8H5CEJ3_9AGAR|nr:hypothetical protein D9611_007813 [Tulosesus angulatus]